MASPESIAQSLSRAAKAAGAQAHDVLAVSSRTTGISVRGGELEDIEASGGTEVGLRVFLGQRQAVVSGSDMSEPALAALAERAVAMAKAAPEDPYAELAPVDLLATSMIDLDLCDPTEPSADELKARAQAVERAALDVDGVAQAEGASASHTRSAFHLLTSHGFGGGWESSRHTIGVGAYAMRDGTMERDYDQQGRRFLSDLPDVETVGRTAGERAMRRLGARQMSSGPMPVLFERRVADRLVGGLLSAMSGQSIARGTSFLKDRMGETLFSETVTLLDDPTRRRGLASRPFDGEGVTCAPITLIEKGRLQSWLLNTASAKKLGLSTNGRGHRSVGASPGVSPTNVWLQPGDKTPEQLRTEIGQGLQITEMFGPSLNPNTGDYSVGVAGFAIEGGEIAYPVSEITIAGNLLDMFANIEVANDLVFDGAIVSPSVRIDTLTVAGA